MDNREKILEATARVYAEYGYRGSTTRRIAEEAGVNEVTLFRRFGSKSALLDEAIRFRQSCLKLPQLPAEPVDPVREVTEWCRHQMAYLKEMRGLFRKFMCDMQQQPAMRANLRALPHVADQSIHAYIGRLRELGLADTDFDASAAVQMLRGALFGDVMGRDMAPGKLPQPEKNAPALYAILFLRAIGCAAARAGAVGSGSKRERTAKGSPARKAAGSRKTK